MRSAMRVLAVSKFGAPGGVNKVLVRTCSALRLAGASVELLFLRREPSGIDLEGVHHHTALVGKWESASVTLGLPALKTLFRDGFDIESAPEVFSWLLLPLLVQRTAKIDVVLYADENLAAIAHLANILTRIPFAVLSHEGKVSNLYGIGALQKSMLSRAIGILTPSPSAEDSLIRSGYRRVLRVGLACPVNSVAPKERFLLFDTRWSPGREPGKLLDILEREPRLHAVISGSFPNPSVLRTFKADVTRRDLERRVTYSLRADESVTTSLYQRALAFARWPERHGKEVYEQGIGWGFFRAIENGCPLIIDQGLSASRIIETGVHGFVVDGTPESFSRAAADIMDDEGLAQTLSRNCIDLAERLSISRTARPLREFLEEGLAEHGY